MFQRSKFSASNAPSIKNLRSYSALNLSQFYNQECFEINNLFLFTQRSTIPELASLGILGYAVTTLMYVTRKIREFGGKSLGLLISFRCSLPPLVPLSPCRAETIPNLIQLRSINSRIYILISSCHQILTRRERSCTR